MQKVLIIGAGMAGSIAARLLAQAGLEVEIIEKSRGAGGRMATKRMKNTRADHGAQYFSAKSPLFQKQVQEWESKDLIQSWKRNEEDQFDRFYAKNGMSSLPKDLVAETKIDTQHRVTHWAKEKDTFQVFTEEGAILKSDYLICTAPAPQALEMMKKSNGEEECLKALSAIRFDPCIALLIVTDKKISLGKTGSQKFDNSPFAWMMSNDSKGFAALPTYTLHSNHEFAATHFEMDNESLQSLLLQHLPEDFKKAKIEEVLLHKWRYSIASKRHSETFLQSRDGVYFGGDGFGIGNVEGAFLSGVAMAQDLLQNI